jgi:hypothetical protein
MSTKIASLLAAGTIVLNWGMGADSSAIIVRVIKDPAAREALGIEDDFSNLVILTAMVGSEYPDTKRLGEEYILPLLREHGIRFVQVGRNSKSTRRSKADPGYAVIEDSTSPSALHIDGAGFTLVDEMLNNGTVPQYRANSRTCSQKFKGVPCDRWLEDNLGDRPFVQVFGFNAEEQSRADKDDSYTGKGKLNRSTRYPLIEWGWTRKDLEDYPFQGTKAGRDGVLERICKFPEAAAEAMMMERASLALNPRQPLFASKGGCEGFYSQVEGGQGSEAFVQLRRKMASCDYAVYQARRVVFKTKGGKGGVRDLSIEAEGSREEMASYLAALAAKRGLVVEEDDKGALRVWVEHRDESVLPAREELFVVAPKAAQSKTNGRFAEKWAEAAPKAAPKAA